MTTNMVDFSFLSELNPLQPLDSAVQRYRSHLQPILQCKQLLLLLPQLGLKLLPHSALSYCRVLLVASQQSGGLLSSFSFCLQAALEECLLISSMHPCLNAGYLAKYLALTPKPYTLQY